MPPTYIVKIVVQRLHFGGWWDWLTRMHCCQNHKYGCYILDYRKRHSDRMTEVWFCDREPAMHMWKVLFFQQVLQIPIEHQIKINTVISDMCVCVCLKCTNRKCYLLTSQLKYVSQSAFHNCLWILESSCFENHYKMLVKQRL